MSGINEIQSRIQAIQNRVTAPPVSGHFNAVFAQQMAAANATAAIDESTQSDADSPVEGNDGAVLVAPQSQTSANAARIALGSTAVTLGMMLGISATPVFAARSGTVARSDQLTDYLAVNGIEARNGHLGKGELTAVTGGWN
jgi:hypothetical protein